MCKGNSVKLLHVPYSDFDARVNHKNESRLTVLAIKFVICLRGMKYTVTGSGFALDVIIPINRGNLSFFLAT